MLYNIIQWFSIFYCSQHLFGRFIQIPGAPQQYVLKLYLYIIYSKIFSKYYDTPV